MFSPVDLCSYHPGGASLQVPPGPGGQVQNAARAMSPEPRPRFSFTPTRHSWILKRKHLAVCLFAV